MYATDRRQTKASLNASALWRQRHKHSKRKNSSKETREDSEDLKAAHSRDL